MNEKFYKQFADMIAKEDNHESKEIGAMLYGMIMYMDYIKEVDLGLHKKALEFMTEMNGLEGIKITILEKLIPLNDDEFNNEDLELDL